MKKKNRFFWLLFAATMISTILVLPYALVLQKDIISQVNLPISVIVLVSIIQSAIIFGIAVYFGNILAEKNGFRLPLFAAWTERRQIDFRSILRLSILAGLATGLAILLLDRYVFPLSQSFNLPSPWWGLLASFYGGIGEEVLMRLFLLSLIIFITSRLFRRSQPSVAIIWPSIVLVAVIFGLSHLPATAAITPITPIIVTRAIVLNGIGGVIFGWLFWRKGLVAAMIAHFTADLVIHFFYPLILWLVVR